MRRLFFTIFLTIPFLFSCRQNDESLDDYGSFQSDLWPYLSNFEEQARLRGLNIDLPSMNVNGRIEEIDDKGVAGYCRWSPDRPNEIVIDESFWNMSDRWAREFVLFHELGHCILGRGHREDQYSNGQCVSIMQSGLGSCWIDYGANNKEAYLDELFLYH